ncbi:protein amalgam-like [Physella acuta]|uniref:protein amalgam-like n=1 Tax=Physella acuta TaxID=109671 RepID=UPI0027DD147E|nr:protein amalgam-like [Physella acuta]
MASASLSFFYWTLVCIVYCVSAQDPEIVNDIFPEVKQVGMTARLNCTVARLGNNAVQWSFSGQGLNQILSRNEEIIINNPRKGNVPIYEIIKDSSYDRVTFTLVINRLMPEYSGSYQCSIIIHNKPYDHLNNKTGYVTVLQPPMIRPGSTDAVKMIEKGGNSSITCDAFGVPFPNITWVRSDGKLLPNGKAIFRGRTLPIMSADVRYSGVYRCVADNSIKPPAESLTQVYVFQAPTVRVLQNSVGQFANGRLDAKLDCIVQGYPTPTVYWMVVNEQEHIILKNSDKYETTKQATDTQNLFNGEQWYSLKVRYVQALDFRDYYCVGVNSKGQGNATVTLFSTWDCQGPLCYSLEASGRGGANLLQLFPLRLLLIAVFVVVLN